MNNQSQQELTESSKRTSTQQQRYDYLFPIYGEESDLIVRNLTGRGRNSWPSFLDKMDQVTRAKASDKEYYNSLYEEFPLNELVAPNSIIGKVGEVRRNLGLSPYIDRLKIQSEHDFFLVFIVEDVYEDLDNNGTLVKVFKGYRPIMRVNPE